MAYLYDDISDEERKKLEEGQQAAGGGPESGAAGGSSLLGGGGTAALSSGDAATPSSSGWTNLRSYLDANKEQGADLSGRVAGAITEKGGAAASAVSGGVTDYQNKLDAAQPGDVSGMLSTINSDPSAFASNPDNVARFKSLRSGIFNGPEAFDLQPNYAELAQKATEASDLGKTAQSQGGQRELIRNLSPNQTAGQLDLNQLLVSGEPTARDTISKAAEPFANLRSQFDSQVNAAKASRDKAMADTTAAAGKINTEFVAPTIKSAQDLEGSINQRAMDASADASKKNKAIADLKAHPQSLAPDEESMFFPIGRPADQYNRQALFDRLIQHNWTAYADNDQRAIDYTNGLVDYLLGNNPGFSPGGAARQYYDKGTNKQDLLNQYKQDPFTGADWFNQFFSGTAESQGDPTAAGVSTPEETSRLLALQKMIDELSPYFTDDDLSKAGTFKKANISPYQAPFQPRLPVGGDIVH